MNYLAAALIAMAFLSAGTVLILNDHPWIGVLLLFVACGVRVIK